jgi:hypothetical protein
VLVSRKKWAKTKRLIAKFQGLMLTLDRVDHKVTDISHGFLVYTARTYKPLNPFLIGLHMSIYSWRPGRDEEGWRSRQAEVETSWDYDDGSEDEASPAPGNLQLSGLVNVVSKLQADAEVMIQLTATEGPPL